MCVCECEAHSNSVASSLNIEVKSSWFAFHTALKIEAKLLRMTGCKGHLYRKSRGREKSVISKID